MTGSVMPMSDPRPALNQLIAAFERHLEASSQRRGEDDPTVVAAYEDLADAFEAYDDALHDATGEMTPLVVVDEQQPGLMGSGVLGDAGQVGGARGCGVVDDEDCVAGHRGGGEPFRAVAGDDPAALGCVRLGCGGDNHDGAVPGLGGGVGVGDELVEVLPVAGVGRGDRVCVGHRQRSGGQGVAAVAASHSQDLGQGAVGGLLCCAVAVVSGAGAIVPVGPL